MTGCDWCHLSEEDREYLLCDSGCWSVFLADEQDYIGRCVLVLDRHCGSMAELTDDEWQDLLNLVRKLEMCLKTVFGADLCNWSCLMNSFFKDPEPCPHLHIHVRPRYRNPVVINGNTYADDAFGHHYTHDKGGRIPEEDMQAVFIRMKRWLDS
ncbi:MAG: HIT family protein [Lachnospiraceae bacterium]|nr:HIT family protein [Lachnospiraceae bacterium]